MSLALELPDALVEALVQQVTERVLEEQARSSNTSPYLDVRDAAEYLRTSPDAIRSLVKRGQLVPMRRRPRLLFEREHLDRWARGES